MILPLYKLEVAVRHLCAVLLFSFIFYFLSFIFYLTTALAVPNDGTNYLKSSNISGGGNGTNAGGSLSSTDYKIIRSTVGEIVGGSPKSTDTASTCEAGGNGVCRIQSGWLYSNMKYAASGNFTSTNLLTGTGASSVTSFIYTLPTLPTGTTASIQFSNNGTNWYNSAGTPNAGDNLTTGTNTIPLSALNWTTPFLYYKISLTGPGNKTPAFDSVSANYGGPSKLKPLFIMSTTDAQNDYVRYKINLCTDIAMSQNCQTFDQTVSQTGWSEQNTQSTTAYTSGTQGYYTVQSDLAQGTLYYWRVYALDPAGSNDWSLASEINSFTSGIAGTPTNCDIAEILPATNQVRLTWTDNANIEDATQIEQSVGGGGYTQIGSVAPNITSFTNTLTTAGFYRFRLRIVAGPNSSDYCVAPTTTWFPFPNIKFEGILFR